MSSGRLLTFVLWMVLLTSTVWADDWPQWLGPNRDGISTEEVAAKLLFTPRQHWRASIGVGVSSIVVSGDRAFMVGHERGPANNGIDTVYCLNADTGAVIWTYPYDCLSCQTQDVRFYGPRSTPTVDGNKVFTLSLDGQLFCFEAASGKVIWSKELPRDLKGRIPVYGYCCSPLVYGRLLILELNAKEASYMALDKSNGAVIWKHRGGQVTCGSPVLTNIDGVDCAVFMGAGNVVGVDAATGAELWRHSTWGHAWMGPVVSGDRIFVANASLPRGCGMIRIDEGKPSVVWEDRKKFQTLHCNSVIWKGHIYGIDNTGTDYQGKDSKKSSLKCLDLDTGQVKWVKPKMGWGNLIVLDGMLIILRETGELVIAQASSHGYEEFLRARVLGGQSWTVPALSNGKLYCRNNSGDVVCLQLVETQEQVISQETLVADQAKSRGKQQTSEGVPATAVIDRPHAISSSARQVQQQWPRFRGPGGLGIAPFKDVPISWDMSTGKGALWRTMVPLPGQSSPVVWQRHLFLTGANNARTEVYCFDTETGKSIWQKVVAVLPEGWAEKVGDDVLLAAPTVVTDGYYVCAIFGTGDVICLDFDGTKKWARNLGIPDNSYGHSSSLEIWQKLLLVQFDQGSAETGTSKLMALDPQTGQTVWQIDRPVPCSWGSPIVISVAGRDQIITCGEPWVIAYDPATGAEIWRVNCLSGEVVPSPTYGNGVVYAVSPDGKLAAIRPDGQGDVTQTHVIWSAEEGLPSICSPVCAGELIFLVESGGLVTCYDARNGKKVWQKELEKSFQASPTVVNDLLYLLSDEGVLFILRASNRYELVERVDLEEPCQASPAFQRGRLYIRTKDHLYCFSTQAN